MTREGMNEWYLKQIHPSRIRLFDCEHVRWIGRVEPRAELKFHTTEEKRKEKG